MGGTGGQQKQGNHLAAGTTQSQSYFQNSAESCTSDFKEASVFGRIGWLLTAFLAGCITEGYPSQEQVSWTTTPSTRLRDHAWHQHDLQGSGAAPSSLGGSYGPSASGTGVRLGEHGKRSSRLLSGGELRSGCRDDGRLAGPRRPELCLAGGRRGRALDQENVELYVPEDAKVVGYNMFSADEPMTKDDMCQIPLKAGARKRLAGNLK